MLTPISTYHGHAIFAMGASVGATAGNDFVTLAYDASTGALKWGKRYNGPANGADTASSVAVSPDGTTVLVTGTSAGTTTGDDYAVIAYNASTGVPQWAKRYNGPANGADAAAAEAVSPTGTWLVVTGRSAGATTGNDYVTLVYVI